MPKLKRESGSRKSDKPQYYEPRVECALFALRDALTGCQTIVRYMAEQEGVDWRDVGPMLDAADSDFAKARAWLRKRRQESGADA
jgi:hypothetical protein